MSPQKSSYSNFQFGIIGVEISKKYNFNQRNFNIISADYKFYKTTKKHNKNY